MQLCLLIKVPAPIGVGETRLGHWRGLPAWDSDENQQQRNSWLAATDGQMHEVHVFRVVFQRICLVTIKMEFGTLVTKSAKNCGYDESDERETSETQRATRAIIRVLGSRLSSFSSFA